MAAELSLLAGIFGTCLCRGFFDCTLAIDSNGGVFLWLLLMGYALKSLVSVCDVYFVPSLECIVDKFNISDDVASVTFIALGSAAPRLCVSFVATFFIVNANGVGAILGSGIFNVLAMVGVTGVIAGKGHSLRIWWYPLVRDAVFYAVSIFELALFLRDEVVVWAEGLILLGTYVVYIIYMRFSMRIATRLKLTRSLTRTQALASSSASSALARTVRGSPEQELGDEPAAEEVTLEVPEENRRGADGSSEEVPVGAVGEQPETTLHDATPRPEMEELSEAATVVVTPGDVPLREADNRLPPLISFLKDPTMSFLDLLLPTPENHCVLLMVLSFTCIAFFAYVVVDAATRTSEILLVPDVVMGLTVVAVGTSIQEAQELIAVARQGEGDMAIANALGTSVFGVLVGLGLPWWLRTTFGGELTMRGEWVALKWDVLILACSLPLLLGMILYSRYRLTKSASVLLMVLYSVYCIYNFVGLFTLRSSGLKV
mmetsp:Transcript_50731/g.117820  ORF Transcript_50731/g.117820 Transcript_50731/m.117820 type:complete len:487 (+) Transcript_50731:101-1561(+)